MMKGFHKWFTSIYVLDHFGPFQYSMNRPLWSMNVFYIKKTAYTRIDSLFLCLLCPVHQLATGSEIFTAFPLICGQFPRPAFPFGKFFILYPFFILTFFINMITPFHTLGEKRTFILEFLHQFFIKSSPHLGNPLLDEVFF